MLNAIKRVFSRKARQQAEQAKQDEENRMRKAAVHARMQRLKNESLAIRRATATTPSSARTHVADDSNSGAHSLLTDASYAALLSHTSSTDHADGCYHSSSGDSFSSSSSCDSSSSFGD